MIVSQLLDWAKKIKEKSITGRYVNHLHLTSYLVDNQLNYTFGAHSVEKRPIYELKLGKGKRKILLWSQMHGNESTTTKSLIDLINLLHSDETIAQELLNTFQFYIVPILNPDGAFYYTRFNANQVDLNRDAFRQTQAEMQYLHKIIKHFEPEFCFNLHDQRTIFSTGNNPLPATLSLLAPAFNESGDVNCIRKKVMQMAVDIANVLQEIIPFQIGRYDDSFNIHCIGDYLTANGIPTLLIEAGHYPSDYERESTRELVFVAILTALLEFQNSNDIAEDIVDKYAQIPENKKLYNDVLVKNVIIQNNEATDIGFQFKEKLIDNKIEFILKIDENKVSEGKFGHVEIDFQWQRFANTERLLQAVHEQIFK